LGRNKFRDFLHGRLKDYNISDDIIARSTSIIDSTKQVPLKDRIHSVLLFMPATIFKNDVLFERMVKSSKIAVSEGYNPLLMITFTDDLLNSEKDVLMETIMARFNVPKHQVIFVPYYGKSEKRDFFTDRESLHILDRIRNSAESFLDSFPVEESSFNQIFDLLRLILFTAFIISSPACIYFLYSRLSESKKEVFVKTDSNEKKNAEESECDMGIDSLFPPNNEIEKIDENPENKIVVLIRHVQTTMQIRVVKDTKLKEISSNVAKTFQVDEKKYGVCR